MREIKFRAFYKGKMRDVVSIDWRNEFCSLAEGFVEIPLKEVELMQYTGLKDLNGVEIYEGDIVEVYHDDLVVKSEVTYSEGEFIVRKYGWESILLSDHDVKVIGNKFQNRELLEVD